MRTLCRHALRCLVLSVAFATPAVANNPPAAPTPETSGLFFRSNSADGLFAAPVLASDIAIDVSGDVARVTVTQRFRNPSKAWLEGIYVYPLPERAAVDRLTMRIGERVVEGKVLEREAAERAYKAAMAAGKRASLLSGARPNVFSTRLANIGPGEEITVEIGYQDQVPFRDGEWSYRFPLVVAPRYTPTAGLPLVAVPPPLRRPVPQPFLRRIEHRSEAPTPAGPGRDLFGPVRHPDNGAINPVSLALRLDAGVPVDTITAANHTVEIVRDGDARALVTLAAGSVPADRDFVLSWRPVPATEPRIGLFTELRDGVSHFLVSLMPPDAARWPTSTTPRDLVLVLDKSGSMHGPSIAGARAAAQLALDRLTPRDRFNVIVFDDKASRLFGAVQPATPENLALAGAALGRLAADGGTEMAAALDMALARQAPEGRLRQIVFLTDGSVSNERDLMELIETKLGATRLFTVGLGSAPNAFFMRSAAEAGRGAFVYIDRPEELPAKMASLHAKLERPALTDIAVDWQLADGATAEMFPATVPDLYIGDPVTFAARIADPSGNPASGSLAITGMLAGKRWHTSVPLSGRTDADGVAAIWARSKVASLRNAWPLRQPDWEAMRTAVLGTSLAYGLVGEFTSLVAIDESEIARPRDEALETAEIERNLPAGMDFEKIFGADAFGPAGMAPVPDATLQDAVFRRSVGLPATATPATAMLAAGAVALLSGLLVLVLVRRLPRPC